MSGLQYLRENRDPNLESVAQANLNQLRSAHMLPEANDGTDGINYDT